MLRVYCQGESSLTKLQCSPRSELTCRPLLVVAYINRWVVPKLPSCGTSTKAMPCTSQDTKPWSRGCQVVPPSGLKKMPPISTVIQTACGSKGSKAIWVTRVAPMLMVEKLCKPGTLMVRQVWPPSCDIMHPAGRVPIHKILGSSG